MDLLSYLLFICLSSQRWSNFCSSILFSLSILCSSSFSSRCPLLFTFFICGNFTPSPAISCILRKQFLYSTSLGKSMASTSLCLRLQRSNLPAMLCSLIWQSERLWCSFIFSRVCKCLQYRDCWTVQQTESWTITLETYLFASILIIQQPSLFGIQTSPRSWLGEIKRQEWSLEDEVLEGVEHFPRAHAAVLVDLNEQFQGVPVEFWVVVPDELDLDDLLEEDVELAVAVAREVVVLDHFDQLLVAYFVYLLRYLADYQLADLLLDVARLALELVDVESLRQRRQGARGQLLQDFAWVGLKGFRDVLPDEVCGELVGEHALVDQEVQRFGADPAVFEQLLTAHLEFLPKFFVVVFEAEVGSDVEQLRQGELVDQVLHSLLYSLVHLTRQFLGLFEVLKHAGQLLGISLMDIVSNALQQLFDPELLSLLQTGEDEEQLDALVDAETGLCQHLLNKVEDLLADLEPAHHKGHIHQV